MTDLSVGQVLREATALGVKFRLAGAGLAIEGLGSIPLPLRHALRDHAGIIWSALDDNRDVAPILLLAELGVKAVLVETRAEARLAVRQLIADLRDHGGPLGLDIETSPKQEYAKPRPCAAINKDGCISAQQPGEKAYKDPAGPDQLRADIRLAQLYAGGSRCFAFRGDALDILVRSHWLRRLRIVAHNAGFEIGFLQQIGYRAPTGRKLMGRYDDTEQAAGLCIGTGHGGEKRSLESAAAAMLGIAVTKHHQLSDWSARKLSPGQLAYACVDAIVCRRLWTETSRIITRDGLWNAYRLQRNSIVPVVDMQRRGLKLDTVEHARQVEAWSRDLANSRHAYVELTASPPPQTDNDVRRWLETVLTKEEHARWKKTESGLLCVDTDELNKLGHVPAARPALGMRAKERLLNNFGPKLATHISPATGRIHCNFRIASVKTGRFSTRNPTLQNLPASRAPEFRQCIVADNGNLLVVADYSQIEVRVAAHNSRDSRLADILASGGDIHRESAAMIASIAVADVTGPQRQMAKAIVFGVIYGQQAEGLAASAYIRFGVEMTAAEAQSTLDRFFGAYPDLHRHLQYNFQLCRRRGYVLIMPSGRLIRKEWEGCISYQDACNWPIQGGAADCMLLAIPLVYRAFRRANVRGGLIVTVHDELLAEVHCDDAALAKEIMQREMTRAFEISFPGAPTTGLLEVGIGNNWRAAKEATKESS